MGALWQNRKLRTLFLILLATILMNAVLAAVSMQVGSGSRNRSFLGSMTKGGCMIDDITAKSIGDSFKEKNAEPGYQYYVLFLHVTNGSSETFWVDNLGFYPTGIEGDDIIDAYLEEKENLDTSFLYDNAQVIPAGEEAVVPYYIQVKEGVRKIGAYYYGGGDLEEAQEIEITLQ